MASVLSFVGLPARPELLTRLETRLTDRKAYASHSTSNVKGARPKIHGGSAPLLECMTRVTLAASLRATPAPWAAPSGQARKIGCERAGARRIGPASRRHTASERLGMMVDDDETRTDERCGRHSRELGRAAGRSGWDPPTDRPTARSMVLLAVCVPRLCVVQQHTPAKHLPEQK